MIIKNIIKVDQSAQFTLIWKAWYESKARFYILLAGLVLIIAYIILSGPRFIKSYRLQYPDDPLTYTEYVWQGVFNYYFQGLWVFSAIILGTGGILREKARGFSDYTLGLPISRKQIMATRFYVGVAESIFLGILPPCLIPLFSLLAGQSYPLIQAFEFGFLLVSAGILFHALSFLLSSLLSGEFAAFLLGFSVASISFFAFKARSIHRWSIFDLMNGANSIDPSTHLIVRALPWPGIVICVIIAIVFFELSIQAIKRRNF